MSDSGKTRLFRMTHIENVPHILRYGITHSESQNANPEYVPIGDASLISSRGKFVLDNGRRLSDYIPFYFSTRTPMLYVIQKGFNLVQPTPADKIVYCVTSVQAIIDLNLEFVFTNGHAIDKFTSQYYKSDVSRIREILDWEAINSKYWTDGKDLDLKRRKEAEFLVENDIPAAAVLGYVVYSAQSQARLETFGISPKQIAVKPDFYF
jgi:hypothetical protein